MSAKSYELFTYQEQFLYFNGHRLSEIDAIKNYTGPVYLYDLNLIQQRIDWIKKWKNLGQLHFAMKSNYSEIILKLILKNKCGVDVVSLGEIKLALKVGFSTKDILFSGVGKTKKEIEWAIKNDVYQINVESISELKRIKEIADQLKKAVQIGLRLNPEIDAKTHPHIATALMDSKFGFSVSDLPEAEKIILESEYIILKAMSFHIGSQVMDVSIFKNAIFKMKPLYLKLKKTFKSLDRFDLGGGLGLNYKDHNLLSDFQRWDELQSIYEENLSDINAIFLIEIGRFIVARAAVLVTQVQYVKETKNKSLVILDVGMNNLIRPMLYEAYHKIYSVTKRSENKIYSVVGPLCESSDVFHSKIELSQIKEDDIVIIADCGAYAKSMSSNYNLQPIAEDIYLDLK